MQVLGNLRRTLRYIIYNGIATSSMTTMTSSAIVVAYALLLGADAMHIGLIGNVDYICFFSYFICRPYTSCHRGRRRHPDIRPVSRRQ